MEAPFPLVEAAVVALLDSLEGHHAGTDLPERLEALSAPFHRVSRGPGSDDGITDDTLVDVETFAPSRYEAAQAAEHIRQVMLSSRAREVSGVLLDDVTTASGPAYLNYNNPAVARYVASYRVNLRRKGEH